MTVTVVPDPWQARLDRMRRIVPLPLLAGATVAAFTIPDSWFHHSARFTLVVPAAAASAVLWAGVTAWPQVRDRPHVWPPLYAIHTVLAAALVWAQPAYGVFAYVGFLFAYNVARRWRIAAFAATALVVSASLTGGYPDADAQQTIIYVVVSAVLLALVLNTATITVRMMEQNQDRGHMIAELAETNRLLEASMAENAELQARLVAQARDAGVVEERQRLAGEIHDTLAQGLTGIIAQLQAARQTAGRPDEAQRHLDQAGELARSSLVEARRSVRALRPEQLESASLPDALAELLRTWGEQASVTAELEVVGDPPVVEAEVDAALFRVTQEALANVAAHARATKVRVTLTTLDTAVLVDVVDDGVGFDPVVRTDGYGLAGMRQRLDRVGGTLTMDSGAGAGTTLNAAVPRPTGAGG